eukprot:UN21960
MANTPCFSSSRISSPVFRYDTHRCITSQTLDISSIVFEIFILYSSTPEPLISSDKLFIFSIDLL